MDQRLSELARLTSDMLILSGALSVVAAIRLTNVDERDTRAKDSARLAYHAANITFHIAMMLALTLAMLAMAR